VPRCSTFMLVCGRRIGAAGEIPIPVNMVCGW
jgi:hypothetical protein